MVPDLRSPGATLTGELHGKASDDGAPAGGSGSGAVTALPAPRTIPREHHSISRKRISANAVKVLYRLHNAGFQAHLVGGGVRDLLLGVVPKDFDIATDATPNEVRSLFRNCRLIGRRFRLAHVVFGREVVEVATFRGDHRAADSDDAEVHEHGRILRDNVFGEIEDDAFRRDFTINALYYDISRFAVLDYTGGLADLEARQLRLIGDPEVRYREDPVRMLRAARFAAKLDFDIAADTAAPMAELGEVLRGVPPSRLFDEVLKLFQSGHAVRSAEQLRRHGLLRYLFPATDAALDAAGEDGNPRHVALIGRALENTDLRIAEGKPVTPAFLYAALLWPRAMELAAAFAKQGESPIMAMQRAASQTIEEQQGHTALPKRFSGPVREIWLLQSKLERYRGKRARRLLGHPRLRAAWDFLCLRRDAGEDLGAICDEWQRAMAEAADGEPLPGTFEPAEDHPSTSRGRRRRRGGRGRGRGNNGEGGAAA